MIEVHLSVTSGSSRERTRAARLADRDSNDCAISPPIHMGSACIHNKQSLQNIKELDQINNSYEMFYTGDVLYLVFTIGFVCCIAI